MNSTIERKVFFITGCSKGFGLSLSKLCLKRGHYVASTSRSLSELSNVIKGEYVSNDNFLPLEVDITNENSVKNAISKTIEKFGHIDVLINNAGYFLMGSLEELSTQEIRDIFECNIFGLINVTRQVLPHFRTCDKSLKRIVNISSIAGLYADVPGTSMYSASKFAVEALSEGLQDDVKEFGIHVSTVLPGYFKTKFFDSLKTASNPMREYTKVRESVHFHQNINSGQMGNPSRASEIIIQHSLSKSPSHHLFLGSDSLKFANIKLKKIRDDMNSNYDLTVSTDSNKSL